MSTLLFGCVEADVDRQFSESERRQASIATVNCLKAAVARIDDGVSDAMTIGATALSICQKEAGVDAYMAASQLNPAARRRFLQMIPETQLQIAIEVVLLRRATGN
jgi:hypothetical protein